MTGIEGALIAWTAANSLVVFILVIKELMK